MTTTYQTEVLYRSYLQQVERSGVLRQDGKAIPKNRTSLPKVLSASRLLARREFARVHREIVTLFEKVSVVERTVKEDIEGVRSRHPDSHEAWYGLFEELERNLSAIFVFAQRTLVGSMEEKVRRMDNFTICLFGKTKAGKSTTMEALTCGRGSTIGAGRQNTTLTAEEYRWNGLTVIDTPGIDSMEERKELETTALESADRSDLILFLMPHQIEEADFVQFGRFYKQNKPVVILLNVKADTGKADTADFEDFLHYGEREVFGESDIAGYKSRIDDFVLRKLGIGKGLIPIVPVHSLSAFLARRDGSSLSDATRRQLLKISRFDALEQHLAHEVVSFGELYRIKNPYDTAVLFSHEVANHFSGFGDLVSKQQAAFEASIKRFDEVKQKIRKLHMETIQKSLDTYFQGKRSSVSGVVEELFDAAGDEAAQKSILERFMPEQQVQRKAEEAQGQIRHLIEEQIADFFRQFQRQLEAIAVEARKADVGRSASAAMGGVKDIGDTADALRGLGVISGVASGVLFAVVVTEILGPAGTVFGIGAWNFWNPVGWGLMGLGLVLGVWAWSKKGEAEQKRREAKRNAATKLTEIVDDVERRVKGSIAKWVEHALANIQQAHIDVMQEYVEYAKKHLSEVADLTEFLRGMTRRMENAKFQSMIRRLTGDEKLHVVTVAHKSNGVEVVVRGKGHRTRASLETALSRVEETSVALKWRSVCHS